MFIATVLFAFFLGLVVGEGRLRRGARQ